MTQPGQPEWSDDNLSRPPEPDALARLREEILRQLVQGRPRGEIEDDLIRDGHSAEYAVALVDSVMRTGQHDGVIHGTATLLDGREVWFVEDPISKRKRLRAERGQRKIREIAAESAPQTDDLAFDSGTGAAGQLGSYRSTMKRRLLLALAVTALVVASALLLLMW